jgi:hypothetical protein
MDKLWAIDMQFAVAVVFFALSVGFVLSISMQTNCCLLF